MPTAVVAHCGNVGVLGDQRIDGLAGHGRTLDGGVEVVDVRLMVLRMVNFHRLSVNMGLQSAVGVGKVG